MNLGMTEIMIIMVIALIVFGPRKLPELGKTIGQALAQFRRASDDFKRTWEQEVEIEKTRKPDSLSTSSSADYQYQSGDSYPHEDPYNYDSWREKGTEEGSSEAAPENAPTADAPAAEPAVAATGSEPAGKESGKKHWI